MSNYPMLLLSRAVFRFPMLAAIFVSLILAGGGGGIARAESDDGDDSLGAVYDFRSWTCETDGKDFTLVTSGQITINNARGEEYASLVTGENSFVKLKKVKVRVTDGNGNGLYTRDKGDMFKVCGYGSFEAYRDDCRYMLEAPAPRYPYTIEYEYTQKSRSLFFWRGAVFQSDIPVRSASYTLEAPDGFRFRYRLEGFEATPQVDSSDGRIIYRWEMTDIPPLEDIDYAPPGWNEYGRIVFAAYAFVLDKYYYGGDDWATVGGWYRDLAEDQYLVDPVPGECDAMAAGELVGCIYDDVAASIRYVAIETGIGGWRPYKAEETRARGYGDCKDITTLLIARLRNRGITAYPALVLTRNGGRTDTSFASFEFNHVIATAIVGTDTLWMDPTCRYCLFGDLPRAVEDITALIIAEDGGHLVRTPGSKPEDNRTSRTIQLHIDNNLKAKVSVMAEVTGNYASYLRNSLPGMDRDEKERYLNRAFASGEKNFQLKSYTIENLDNKNAPVSITLEGILDKKVRNIGSSVYCPLLPLIRPIGTDEVDVDDREIPLDLYYPDIQRDRVVVTWDTALSVDSTVIPAADSGVYAFGELSLCTVMEPGQITVNFVKSCTAYLVDVADLHEFAEYQAKLKDMLDTRVRLDLRSQ